jgi:hypothetical protein
MVAVELDSEDLPRAFKDHPTAAEAAVETVIEIWRVDDEWWRQPIARRYVEVVLKGGKHLVLYEDLVTGDWYKQNV